MACLPCVTGTHFGAGSTPSARLEDNRPVDPLDRIGTPGVFKSAPSFHRDDISALIYRKSIAQIMRYRIILAQLIEPIKAAHQRRRG
jgi:hypothetical protein